ncbi:hypothetical protein BGZ98_008164 [Dissophora globulifera]|nr:hypothetical protein BGZ98_008164 [Dissophora globulifera]
MAAPSTLLSDSASPQRLRKINSPFMKRSVFGTSAVKLTVFDNTHNDANASDNHATLATRSVSLGVKSSVSSLSMIAGASVGSRTLGTPKGSKDGKFTKLINSFSNPSLFQAPSNNIPHLSYKAIRLRLKFGRSASMMIESPSSESATESLTSIQSLDSWGERRDLRGEKKSRLRSHTAAASVYEVSPVRTMSQSQPVLPQLLIGPIARKNFRDRSAVKEEEILRTSQMLTVPGKERVRTMQNNGSEAPTLDLNPFSPYSPGIMISDMARTTIRLPNSRGPIDLNEYGKRGDFRPRDDDDDSDEEIELELEGEEAHTHRRNNVTTIGNRFFEEITYEISITPESPIEQPRLAQSVLTLAMEPTHEVEATESDIDSVAVEAARDPQLSSSSNEDNLEPLADMFEDALSTIPSAANIAATTTTATATSEESVTESEAIAKQWRRDQSTSMIIQRHDGSTVEHIVHHETFSDSQFLLKRQRRQNSQCKRSSGSLRIATKGISASAGPSSPLIATSSRLADSPDAGTAVVLPETSTSTSDDDSLILTPSVLTEGSTLQERTFSPCSLSSSVNIPNTAETVGKKPAKIDTDLPGSAITPSPQTAISSSLSDKYLLRINGKNKSTLFTSNGEEEQVISSKVSRSGKLFAKKIKTIAVFEYNTAKKLGKGNFGIVYQGKRIDEETEVAIKKITRKLPGEIEKLGLVQREMRTGIVPLLDIITTNKHHYLVFQKAEGDLAEMLKGRNKDAQDRRSTRDASPQQPMSPSCSLGSIFSIHEIRSIMHTVVLGTQALHKGGYSHKDIKPANILFREGRGLLCDFGLCSRGDELPQNQFFGTQDYASPEARRVGGHRHCDYIQSDIYSLGAVLYELATGSVLSRVISQGLNWQRIALFGGRSFCELLQGMINDIEKRWTIDQVVQSRFWDDEVARIPAAAVAVASAPTTSLSQSSPSAVEMESQQATKTPGDVQACS